jgi:GNAT superfamily N-acetyltransferase
LVADPGLVRFAFVKGEPVAMVGAFPDPYYPMHPKWKWYGDSDIIRVLRLLRMKGHIPRIRLMFFGVRPGFRNLGIDAILFNEVKKYAIEKGYNTCEASLLLEDNHLILSPSEFMGAKRYKTWRIYDLPLIV